MKEHIIINKDRTVVVPDSVRKIGIQYDHKVNTLTFDCPRYADDNQSIDLSRMAIYINFSRNDKTKGSIAATNVFVDPDDPEIMHFDFVITRSVTLINGPIICLVCAKSTDAEGVEVNHWNSELFNKLSIGEGMEAEEELTEEEIDYITSLLQEINTTHAEVADVDTRVEDLEFNQEKQGVVSEVDLDAMTWTEGSYITGSGTVGSSSGYGISELVALPKMSTLILDATGYQSDVAMIAKSDHTPLVTSVDGKTHYEYYTDDEIQVYISCKTTVAKSAKIVRNVGETLSDLERENSELKGDLAELNTIRKKIKSIDGYISVDGIIKQSTISKVYYFECEQNTLYYFNANKITKLPEGESFIIGELSNDIFIGANVGGINFSHDLVKTYASSGNTKYICFCIPRINENVFFVEELYKIRQNQSDNNEINIIDNMRVSFYDINNDGHYKEVITRDDDFIITDYIEITNDTLLFEYGCNTKKSPSVACFDSNKKFLYSYSINNDRKISFKSEVKYIIATVPKIKGANISKNDGSIVFIYNDFNFNYLKLKEKMDYIQNGSDYLHYIFAFCSPIDRISEYIVIRNDRISTLDYIKTNGNSFKFVIPKGLKMYLWQYRDDFSYIQSDYGHEGIVTIKPIGAYIKCSFKTLDGSDISMDMLNDFSLSKIDESIIEEIPNTYPEEVGYRKSEQWVNLKWTPKNKVPMQGGASYFPANIERIGMLYGEGAYQDKRVGADVSLRTFMTAINNPYSLMYTENTNENHSQSAYGVTYYGDYNSGAYMGMSCNIFVYNVLGSPITWSSFETDGGSAIDENIVEKVYDQSSHGLRLMDILATQGHVKIVSRLWRNKRNVVKKIQVSEIVGSGAINVLYSDTEFDSFLKNNNYRIYRFKELYKNIDYEQSPFVTLDDEDVLSYTYNNDICTFAGDYASFAEGDLIHINYEKGIYTSMQIYKDDNLIDTISIGEGHDVDLTNKNYSYGKYKARLTDGTNHSDFTYWEILNLEISLNGEELTYSSENGRPVFWSWCEYRGWHKHKHSLVGEDSHKTINVGNRPDSTYKYIKVYVDGEYGRIARRLVVE